MAEQKSGPSEDQIEIVGDVINDVMTNLRDNIPRDEMTIMMNAFKDSVDLDRLNEEETGEVIQYVKDFVPNKEMRFFLLESLNNDIAQKWGRLHFNPDEPDEPKKSPPAATDEEPKAADEKRDIEDLPPGDSRFSRIGGDREKIVILSRDLKKIDEIRDKIEDINDFVEEKTNLGSRGPRVTTTKNKALLRKKMLEARMNTMEIYDQIRDMMSMDEREQFEENDKALFKGKESKRFKRNVRLTEIIPIMNENLKIYENAIGRILSKAQKEKDIFLKPTKSKKIENLPTTQESMRQFIDDIDEDIKKMKEKDEFISKKISSGFRDGLSAKRRKSSHNFGQNIAIITDMEGHREVIITEHVRGDELAKFAHAITTEPGVLMDFNKNVIIETMGKGKGFKILLKKLIDLVKSLNPNELVRLLYKPASKVGGHFVGGAFTRLYNKKNDHEIMVNKINSHSLNGRGTQFHQHKSLPFHREFFHSKVR